ncbi:hypothetical protein ACO1L4_14005, partial [Staphylococcus aureus]
MGASDQTLDRLSRYGETLKRIARLSNAGELQATTAIPSGSAQIVVGEATYVFNLADYIDLD